MYNTKASKGFAMVPRYFFALLAGEYITLAEFAILCVIADRTLSWKRLSTPISTTDFETATGLSRRHVLDCLESLHRRKRLIARIGEGRQRRSYGLLVPKVLDYPQSIVESADELVSLFHQKAV